MSNNACSSHAIPIFLSSFIRSLFSLLRLPYNFAENTIMIDIHCLDEQWKQTLGKVGSWKALSNKIKKLGLKYRFLLLDYIQNAVFSKSYTKANWACYAFS